MLSAALTSPTPEVVHVGRLRAVGEYSATDDLWLDVAANALAAVGPGLTGGGTSDAFLLDRLALNWASPVGDLSAGRQAWGHGSARVFPVTDLVRPFSPASVDTEFKQGVDMVRWSRPISESFELEALGLRDDGLGGLGRVRIVVPMADVSVVGGLLSDDPVAGAAFAGDLLGAGWYVEGLYRAGDTAQTAGASYMLPGRVTVTAEALHNDGAYPLMPGRWWAAALTSVELTPLVTADAGALIPLAEAPIDRLLFGGLTANVADESTVRLGWVDKAFYTDVRSAF